MARANILIIKGYGINCDVETGWAFEMAGADKVTIDHVNRVVSGEISLDDYQMLVFPGGFSFGDHIASGKVLGLKIKQELGSKIVEFVSKGKLMMGICNGFQVMVKMGLLPGDETTVFSKQTATLTTNDSAHYEDRWVNLKTNTKNSSPFLRNLENFPVAIRHGEGKFMADETEMQSILDNNLVAFQYIDESGNPTMEYPKNPNGAYHSIAGITNKRGNILGMMPHPEVFISKTQHPNWTRSELPEEGLGLAIFRNAVNYIKNEL